MPTPEEGSHVQFSQKLVLTNADEYDKLMQNSGLADWSVTVKVGGDNGDTYQFSNREYHAQTHFRRDLAAASV